MNTILPKGLEPFIIRFFALFISATYILGPLNEEVKSVLHFVTHQLEAPEYVLSHKSNHLIKIHLKNHTKHRDINEGPHKHEVISFFTKVFQNQDEVPDHSKTPKKNKLKIDKHTSLVIDNIPDETITTPLKRNLFYFQKNKIQKGFLRRIKEPPQAILFFT